MLIEAVCIECDETFDRDAEDKWRVRCIPCWRAMKAEEKPNAATAKAAPAEAIPAARIKELVQLCHPDKHRQSALSQKVTTWLLGLRQVR